jgi:hypothetical protein
MGKPCRRGSSEEEGEEEEEEAAIGVYSLCLTASYPRHKLSAIKYTLFKEKKACCLRFHISFNMICVDFTGSFVSDVHTRHSKFAWHAWNTYFDPKK